MVKKISFDELVELFANLFSEKREIAVVSNGIPIVIGYTEPKSLIFNSNMVNVSKIPENAIGYVVKKKNGKTVLKLVEIHPQSIVEKLLRG